jgi:cytidylate kinase
MTSNRQTIRSFNVIAIDGGAASGKSSTSIRLAEKCNFLHVDTGSHYRAVTHACLQNGLEARETSELRKAVRDMSFSTRICGHEAQICISGGPPLTNGELRSPEVNAQVSPMSAIPMVREAVKTYQREQVEVARLNGFSGIVMDGRDIGTVILPDADLKIFLKADPAKRQLRRQLEGSTDAIGDRDKRDASRATAPMKAADDAVIIDNSDISLEEVVDEIIQLLPESDA